MKLFAYSVYDKAANAYLPPFFLASRGQAIRSFTDAANDPRHEFSKHAGDYSLFEIGYFDDENAFLFCAADEGSPTNLDNALQYQSKALTATTEQH